MIRMYHVMKICLGAAPLLVMLVPVAHADDFQLSQNQRIACSRGLSAGKLNTATCKSYAYLFNVRTSEYFRCQVSLALTRDNKEVINLQTDGGCTKKPRIFETDSTYSFDATATERHHHAKSTRLHHHLLRARLRHLEVPGHDIPVIAEFSGKSASA